MKKRFLIALILFTLMFTGCSQLFFYPDTRLVPNPLIEMFSPQEVYFKTADGLTLHGWFFTPKQEARGAILVFHGNAGNLGTHATGLLWLVGEGYQVFIFDYRGYGNSDGKAGLKGVHLDAEAAMETLFALPGVVQENIFVLGQSLGGAVAIYTVAHSPLKKYVKGLVIDSAFSSYRSIAREKLGQVWLTWLFQYPLSLLFNDRYSPIKYVHDLAPVPLLIIHGENDPVVPTHHGLRLYDAASNPKELLLTKPEGHVSSFSEKSARERFLRFLRDHAGNHDAYAQPRIILRFRG